MPHTQGTQSEEVGMKLQSHLEWKRLLESPHPTFSWGRITHEYPQNKPQSIRGESTKSYSMASSSVRSTLHVTDTDRSFSLELA